MDDASLKLKQPFAIENKRIWVAGHNGMVGAALLRRLSSENCEIITVAKEQLDLRNQAGVEGWFSHIKPEVVILAAAKVGGIMANAKAPAHFFYDNMMIEANVMHAAYQFGVQRLIILGSSCIYPKLCPQPIKEEYLLSGALEPTNEAYAIAKIAGLKMAQYYRHQFGCDFISAMPCNLYGEGDTYDPEKSHVIPSIIYKMHMAKINKLARVILWGTGLPMREFLDVDDLADALIFVLKNYEGSKLINIGSGKEISIKALADSIKEVVGFEGEIAFDASKPDGTPRKLLDITRLTNLGWESKLCLNNGLNKAYNNYKGRYRDDNGEGYYACNNGWKTAGAG